MDMNLLIMTCGKERRIDEFDELFAAVRLRCTSLATVGRSRSWRP
jgi:hypothetical protein